MQTHLLPLGALGLSLIGCSFTAGGSPVPDSNDPPAPGVTDTCGSVRLTSYAASASGWCEFDRTLPVLPAFARGGLTTAIAEPYDGSSYGGEAGEACGECWEVDTLAGTRTVMVHDLCPIRGNPLCAGGHFHFDLSTEAAQALHGEGLDEARARRVACPVVGNVHLQILDRNQWGYLRFAVVNHRIPVRLVEYRSAGGTDWRAARRSGGAWHVLNDADGDVFAAGRPGGVFRITSAQGQAVESPNVLPYGAGVGSVFDLGLQLADLAPATGTACVFEPPAVVYGDGYGGIPEVRWKMNPWGGASATEVTQGCFGDVGSCLRVEGLESSSGFHLSYPQEFATSTFARLSLRLRALAGGGTVQVAASRAGTRCQETAVTAGPAWSQVTIDLASACSDLGTIGEVTAEASSSMILLLDDIRFEK